MQAVTTIGLDIAKSVFQVHGVDCNGQVVIRRQLKRRYVLAFFEKLAPCLVGIEACASFTIGHASFRHWTQCASDAARLCEALHPACRSVPQNSNSKSVALVLATTVLLVWACGLR